MATQADLHVGDIGTIIYINIVEGGEALDISSATTKTIRFQKKDKTTMDKDGEFKTDGTDGILQYTTLTGDIDQKGRWLAQAYLEMPTWKGYSAKVEFQVDDPLPAPA